MQIVLAVMMGFAVKEECMVSFSYIINIEVEIDLFKFRVIIRKKINNSIFLTTFVLSI